MPKLKYNSDWSDKDEAKIAKALNLSDADKDTLFVQEKTIKITDEQAKALVAIPDDDDGEDGEVKKTEPEATPMPKEGDKDAKEADKPDVVDVHITTQRERAASEAGEKLSEGTNKVLSEGFKARETVNITPLLTFLGMVADLGKEAVQAMPRQNTYLKGGKTWFGTGDKAVQLEGNDTPYDKYSVLDTSGKKPKKVAMSFYKTEARATKEGKRWVAELESVEDALATMKQHNLKTVADGKWKGFAAPALKRRATLFESRIAYIQGALGRAVKLAHQCYAFDSLKMVAYSFEQEEIDGKKEYVNRNEPIQVWDVKINPTTGREQESNPINLSIGAFLKFDVAAAIKIAGEASKVTYEILAKTVERETQKDEPGTKEADWSKHEISNVKEFENVTYSYSNYITTDEGDINSKRVEQIKKRIAEGDGIEFLLALGDLIVNLEPIYKIIEKPYTEASAHRATMATQERSKRNKALEQQAA